MEINNMKTELTENIRRTVGVTDYLAILFYGCRYEELRDDQEAAIADAIIRSATKKWHT